MSKVMRNERPMTSRPVARDAPSQKGVQYDLYLNVSMLDVLENYRKSVDFYNTYD